MKIYRIGIDCRLWGETGVGRYIRILVSNLQEIDKTNEYVLFALPKNKPDIQSIIHNSHLRQGFGGQAKFKIVSADIKWHSVREQFEFPKILEKENLDLVHFPYFSMPIYYKGKYVLTIHDLIINHFPTGKASTLPSFIYYSKYLAYKYVLSQAIKNAEKIITVSQATEKEIEDHYGVPSIKLAVIYEGVDQAISPSASSGQANDQGRKTKDQLPNNYFLYVGNAYPHKNLEFLINAFSQMINDKGLMMKDISLVLIGKEDHFYKRLETKVKEMGLKQNVLFKHDVNDQDLASLYQNALALVAPSLMEGFGLPLLEAMDDNCLVVASDIPVFHEVCGDAAVYVDPHDKEAMVNVLLSVYNKQVKNEQEKKKIGKKRVSFFSWKKMSQETLAVYEGCFGLRQS